MSDDKPGPSAWDAALRLLGVRARSRAEIAERLARRDFDQPTIDDVLARLEESGLIDDDEFAREWAGSRSRYSGRGRLALRRELRTKGVAAHTIEAALAEIEPDDERAQAAELRGRGLTKIGVEVIEGDAAEGILAAVKRLYLLGKNDRPTGTFTFAELLAHEQSVEHGRPAV